MFNKNDQVTIKGSSEKELYDIYYSKMIPNFVKGDESMMYKLRRVSDHYQVPSLFNEDALTLIKKAEDIEREEEVC